MAHAKDNDRDKVLDKALAQSVAKHQVGHAYLFSGDASFEQAVLFAMAVNCLNTDDGYPCGDCEACRRVAALNPDLLQVVEPERGFVRVEAVRSMQSQAHLYQNYGNDKVFIIRDAELMKDTTANSLLKILEEPPERILFILCVHHTDKILPTILSRCQQFHFGSDLPFILNEEQVRQQMLGAEQFLRDLPQMTCAQVMNQALVWEKDKDGLLHYLAALLRVFRNLLAESCTFPFGPQNNLKAALLTERAVELLRRNINQRLLLDVLFLRLWRFSQIK